MYYNINGQKTHIYIFVIKFTKNEQCPTAGREGKKNQTDVNFQLQTWA